ncbi:hypothetical protein BDV96DRAFT_597854 [Lophiotrema nucula]|uniref:Uncharacterized protein n=1 Tax=Lophiotrema nucula TaxID=690887 RepID=A0A6A5ZI28_9PLEO|nr:hypothetical protein BDV96DRAFT_597854 [Lophiotrema nucula]
MRLHVPFAICAFAVSCTAYDLKDLPHPCYTNRGVVDNATCNQPLDEVTAVVPGSFYVAKLPCLDCTTVIYEREGDEATHRIDKAASDLLFNISLSQDGMTLLLNEKPIFPSAPTAPYPTMYVDQATWNFTRADLDLVISAAAGGVYTLSHDRRRKNYFMTLDFDYVAKQTERADTTITWEITFDAIGARDDFPEQDVLSYNGTEQQMLKITVEGVPVDSDDYLDEYQTASTLFDVPEAEPEQRFDLTIKDVSFVSRSYTFPAPHTRNIWEKFVFWLAGDAPRKDGHIVFLQDEWGPYGKKGTLKNELGKIWNDWPWKLVLIVVGGAAGGLLTLYAISKLVKVGIQQQSLARWQGMDDVWRQMRRERTDEDEEGLIDGDESRYRDEPSPRLTSEYMSSKPLPSKPLPEKPLPDVPLIDDI